MYEFGIKPLQFIGCCCCWVVRFHLRHKANNKAPLSHSPNFELCPREKAFWKMHPMKVTDGLKIKEDRVCKKLELGWSKYTYLEKKIFWKRSDFIKMKKKGKKHAIAITSSFNLQKGRNFRIIFPVLYPFIYNPAM